MVHSTSFFTTLRSVINTYVKLPNMYYLYLLLPLTDKRSVSSFAFNLISFIKLTWSLNCCFIFIFDLYSVQDLLLQKTIGVGKERLDLYFMQTPASQFPNLPHFPQVSFTQKESSLDAKSVLNLWYCRLGHPLFARISFLNKFVPNAVPFNSNNTQYIVCPLAKQKRLPFTINSHVSSFLLIDAC